MRIDLCLDPLSAAHPRFRPNSFHPVGETRDEAQIFADMLLTDPRGRMMRPVESVIVGPKMASDSQIPAA